MSKITEKPLGPYDHSYLPGMMGYDQQYSSKMVGVTLSARPIVDGKPVDNFVVSDKITRETKPLSEECFLKSSLTKENKSVEK